MKYLVKLERAPTALYSKSDGTLIAVQATIRLETLERYAQLDLVPFSFSMNRDLDVSLGTLHDLSVSDDLRLHILRELPCHRVHIA